MWIEMHSLIFESGVGGAPRDLGAVKWEREREEEGDGRIEPAFVKTPDV
jgi:hypothetical protein